MTNHRFSAILTAIICSVSFVASAAARMLPDAGKQTSTFVPFINKYLKLPTDWSTTMTQRDMKEKAVFTKSGGGTFEVRKFAAASCDATKLQERFDKAWTDAGKEPVGKVAYARIPGVLGSAFAWQEPSGDTAFKFWCVIPPGRIRTAIVSVNASDGTTAKFVESTVLSQLFQADRKSR